VQLCGDCPSDLEMVRWLAKVRQEATHRALTLLNATVNITEQHLGEPLHMWNSPRRLLALRLKITTLQKQVRAGCSIACARVVGWLF